MHTREFIIEGVSREDYETLQKLLESQAKTGCSPATPATFSEIDAYSNKNGISIYTLRIAFNHTAIPLEFYLELESMVRAGDYKHRIIKLPLSDISHFL